MMATQKTKIMPSSFSRKVPTIHVGCIYASARHNKTVILLDANMSFSKESLREILMMPDAKAPS